MLHPENFVIEISNILKKNHLINVKDMHALKKEFAKRTNLTFEEFIIDENLVDKKNVLKALEEYYKAPALDVEGEFFENHLVEMFPKDVLMKYCFIPFRRDGDLLIIVAANPNDPELLDIIGKYVSYDVALMVGYFRDILDAVEDFYDKALTEVQMDEDLRLERQEAREVEDLSEEDSMWKERGKYE